MCMGDDCVNESRSTFVNCVLVRFDLLKCCFKMWYEEEIYDLFMSR